MRVSIIDVAKKAQVSIATVSRVINQNDYVAPETRKIVEAAIKKTGYHLPQHHLANHTKTKLLKSFFHRLLIHSTQSFIKKLSEI